MTTSNYYNGNSNGVAGTKRRGAGFGSSSIGEHDSTMPGADDDAAKRPRTVQAPFTGTVPDDQVCVRLSAILRKNPDVADAWLFTRDPVTGELEMAKLGRAKPTKRMANTEFRLWQQERDRLMREGRPSEINAHEARRPEEYATTPNANAGRFYLMTYRPAVDPETNEVKVGRSGKPFRDMHMFVWLDEYDAKMPEVAQRKGHTEPVYPLGARIRDAFPQLWPILTQAWGDEMHGRASMWPAGFVEKLYGPEMTNDAAVAWLSTPLH